MATIVCPTWKVFSVIKFRFKIITSKTTHALRVLHRKRSYGSAGAPYQDFFFSATASWCPHSEE